MAGDDNQDRPEGPALPRVPGGSEARQARTKAGAHIRNPRNPKFNAVKQGGQ